MQVGEKIVESRDDGRVVEAQTGQIRGQARPRCVQGAQDQRDVAGLQGDKTRR